MAFIEKLKNLKGIIPTATLETLSDYNIILISSSASKKSYQISKSDKTLTINIAKLPPKEKRNLVCLQIKLHHFSINNKVLI